MAAQEVAGEAAGEGVASEEEEAAAAPLLLPPWPSPALLGACPAAMGGMAPAGLRRLRQLAGQMAACHWLLLGGLAAALPWLQGVGLGRLEAGQSLRMSLALRQSLPGRQSLLRLPGQQTMSEQRRWAGRAELPQTGLSRGAQLLVQVMALLLVLLPLLQRLLWLRMTAEESIAP